MISPYQSFQSSAQLALKEHDEKQFYAARQNLFDIRNVYAILTDIMHKNLSKVQELCPSCNSISDLFRTN